VASKKIRLAQGEGEEEDEGDDGDDDDPEDSSGERARGRKGGAQNFWTKVRRKGRGTPPLPSSRHFSLFDNNKSLHTSPLFTLYT
jgi:hypothetical protein